VKHFSTATPIGIQENNNLLLSSVLELA